MVVKKARVVIVGAGMAGLVAANKLYTAPKSGELFELVVVEGGDRIGGRIRTSELGGDRIEMGATWIHGVGGSPVYKIAGEIGALRSSKPWERMDGFPDDPVTVAEGGLHLDPSLVERVSSLYRNLMDLAKGNSDSVLADDGSLQFYEIAAEYAGGSVGSFLRRGLDAYWDGAEDSNLRENYGSWSRKSLEESIFAMHENTERTYTSAGDLFELDFNAEGEYELFPGEEITIAKGYSRVVEAIASVLPPGLIRLGKKVEKIQWLPEGPKSRSGDAGPVKLHFEDGSELSADHVILTVSLGVLKAGTGGATGGLFAPELPYFKRDVISRLGFGVVNKLFLKLGEGEDEDIGEFRDGEDIGEFQEFPFLQMVFDKSPKPAKKQEKIPWWMRKTVSLCPIYKNSKVLLSWFAGEEALELESLKEDEVRRGVSATLANFRTGTLRRNSEVDRYQPKFDKVLKSAWGTDPLFMGSYSFVTVGSSGDDLDLLAEPLPAGHGHAGGEVPPLQILFAGEATDRTHYSTTHGAYLSGLREAIRLLQYYSC